ncbi:carbon storage regulator CsrA [Amnibacterium setariae]|uniref:Translational regulator CsrA n=1 Tax=Amnibacterium setariae TaxID=2306585 RepID=A0A3A1U1Q6_9MICO|nr:carbon storage regulator CsrA [Amnibacterium setariae]RIX30303.1 carbon storage regulator [Amnibacterium setariae]
MLVLTRKKGERVMIGDDIVVTVIDVRGDSVRIGFDAPRGVSIQRAEVVNAVREANTGAAASAAQGADLLVGLLNRARKPEAAPQAPSAPEAAAPTTPPAPRSPGAAPKPTPPRPRG